MTMVGLGGETVVCLSRPLLQLHLALASATGADEHHRLGDVPLLRLSTGGYLLQYPTIYLTKIAYQKHVPSEKWTEI